MIKIQKGTSDKIRWRSPLLFSIYCYNVPLWGEFNTGSNVDLWSHCFLLESIQVYPVLSPNEEGVVLPLKRIGYFYMTFFNNNQNDLGLWSGTRFCISTVWVFIELVWGFPLSDYTSKSKSFQHLFEYVVLESIHLKGLPKASHTHTEIFFIQPAGLTKFLYPCWTAWMDAFPLLAIAFWQLTLVTTRIPEQIESDWMQLLIGQQLFIWHK